jgi:hypothetical protein
MTRGSQVPSGTTWTSANGVVEERIWILGESSANRKQLWKSDLLEITSGLLVIRQEPGPSGF